ncbi:TPA: MFS transporter [Legionella pneumophila]|nr:MFS transporter [Legionella pneumophila]
MKKNINRLLDIYWGIPSLTKTILPIVIVEHIVAAFCLNISAYFKKVDHLHFDLIGQFISAYYWGCLFGAVIGGALSLKYRTTKISGIGLLFLSGSFFVLFYSVNPWLLNLSMFLLGLIGTMTATCNIASLVRSVKDHEGAKLKVISLELILFNLSYSFTTFILLDLTSEHILVFVKSIIFTLVILGFWSLIFCKNSIFEAEKSIVQKSLRFLPDRKKEFFTLMGMILCFGLIFSMIKVVFTPTLIDRFGSNMVSVTAASVNPWVMFFIQPLIVNRIKSKNSTWFLGLGGLMVGLGYFTFGLVNSFLLTAIVLILLTFGEMMFAPLSKHFNIQLYGKGQDGFATGVWRAVFLGSGTIGPEVSGFLAEKYGSYAVWDICAILGLICFIFSLFLRRMTLRNSYNRVVLES